MNRVLHVLVVASSGVLVVGGDVDLGAALMGKSWSPAVLPVLISGPFWMLVSAALPSRLRGFSLRYQGQWQRARPAWVLSALRALSMTDWWYSYEP